MHEIETVDTRTIINKMMPKFYYYIVEVDLAENPYTAPPAATISNSPIISTEILWGNHELIKGVGISLDKGLIHN